MVNLKVESRIKRKNRTNYRVRKSNKENRPILNLYRSNKNISAQVVVDGKVLVALTSNKADLVKKMKGKTGIERATMFGEEFAKMALAKKVKEVVCNIGAYKYIGRIKAFCEAARKSGLLF